MATNNAINLKDTGIAAYDGAGVFAGRTITAGSTKASVANGNGVSGNPTIDVVPANIDINTLGGSPLTVANGGTGATTLTSNGVLLGNGTSAVTAVTALTNGQLVIGSTGVAPVAAALTAGAGINITNGAGSITISATGSAAVVEVTGTTQALAVNTKYIVNNAALVTLTLPSTMALGDEIVIQGKGAGGWLIAQNASQILYLGSSTTTTGVAGSLASTNRRDAITLSCSTANLEMSALNVVGNLTVV